MLEKFIDFIAPRYCIICGRRLSPAESKICSVCNWHLPRTLFWENPYDNVLTKLFWGRFKIEKAVAWFYYSGGNESTRIVTYLKYRKKAKGLGIWTGKNIAEEIKNSGFFDDIDIIIPVPLTWRRRLSRGYNQSEEIAKGVSEATGLPVYTDVLKRRSFKTSQTRLTHMLRRENVRGAYELCKPEKIKGKHILIIDDVVTTGSTITACSETLSKDTDIKISVLSTAFTK